ncbi:hypothetical protein LOC71_02840 [Rhodopirellula sp. JC740]|uniref:Uncharacterized protein n=1 Tax=Rhodopirellula halodulae TaxID=2894198 RepID=A0ABS8NCB9_9BACT|nr:hypothetical protein [Rhodopirellula sp. JC740]MCC9641195.1 hypothetical protein [Rhodopirellula sp. JC740]
MSTVVNDPFQSGSPTDPNLDPNAPNPAPKKSGIGCFVWGCLGTLLLAVVVMVGSMFAVYYFLTGQVEKYTDTQPAEIPVVQWDEGRLEELQSRIDAFSEQVRPEDENAEGVAATTDENATEETGPDAGETAAPRELRLTSEEINALISAQGDLQGKVYVEIENGKLRGKVTLPMDQIPGGKGRYLNADAEFDVSMSDGVLEVRITDANVKGEPLPEAFMEGFSQQNLAKDVYDDPETAEMLRKFDSIEVVDDAIVLRLRNPGEKNGTEPTEPQPTETEATSVEEAP